MVRLRRYWYTTCRHTAKADWWRGLRRTYQLAQQIVYEQLARPSRYAPNVLDRWTPGHAQPACT